MNKAKQLINFCEMEKEPIMVHIVRDDGTVIQRLTPEDFMKAVGKGRREFLQGAINRYNYQGMAAEGTKAVVVLSNKNEEIQIELIGPYDEYSPAQEKAMALKSKGEIIRHIYKKEEDGKWYIEMVKRVVAEQTIKHHGYKDCGACGGTGTTAVAGGHIQCYRCKGTGMVLDKKSQLVNLGSRERPETPAKGTKNFTKDPSFL